MSSFLLTALLMVVSKPSPIAAEYDPKAIGSINALFQNDLKAFASQTSNFLYASEAFNQGRINQNELYVDYKELRTSFKRVEFLIEYIDKEAYDKLINGAPLPKLEKKVADLAVIEPKGLQVIDELLGATIETRSDRTTLVLQAKKLKKNISNIVAYLSQRKITDRQFFEASRQAIIRITSLGITGFDTPGTLQGINDATTVLNRQSDYISYYEKELQNVGKRSLLDTAYRLIESARFETRNSDFDSFNRLAFIKDKMNPIYKILLDIHLALDYETIDEVSRYPQAINYEADNLFAGNFLNNFYYVSIREDQSYDELAKLGKLLFYDPVLSQNNDMACATCHAPDKAFTDGLTTSDSRMGLPLKRNAMTLNYSVFATRFFHDLRAQRLEDQFEHVVLSDDEFATTYRAIISKLENSPTYVSHFRKAFPGQKRLRSNDIDYALAAYVMKLNSFDSSIDQYFQGHIDELPKDVQLGFNLFTGKAACATCHFTPLFSGNLPPLFIDSEAEVLGVPNRKEEPWEWDEDMGRLENGLTQEVAPFYKGAFKTPTIRNIDKTAPYMHNGVFHTLEEVMDFYNQGGGAGRGLGIDHQTLAPDPLELSEDEIDAIIAFMKALNDETTFTRPKEVPRDFDNQKINERSF